jgi:type IV secretory pathway protease TraF
MRASAAATFTLWLVDPAVLALAAGEFVVLVLPQAATRTAATVDASTTNRPRRAQIKVRISPSLQVLVQPA